MSKVQVNDEIDDIFRNTNYHVDMQPLMDEYYAIMKEEGRKLDPRIAMVCTGWADFNDRYEFGIKIGYPYKNRFACNPDGPWVCEEEIPDQFWTDLLPEIEREKNFELLKQGKFSFDYEDVTFERREELLSQLRKMSGFDEELKKYSRENEFMKKITELAREVLEHTKNSFYKNE